MRNSFFPLLVMTLLLSGCIRHKPDQYGLTRVSASLIDSYVNMSEIELHFNPESSSLILYDIGRQGIWGDEMDKLTEKYDDWHYNKPLFPGTYGAFANEFTAITVTSDAEFNGIESGENIGAKMRIVAVSPYKWLKSKGTLEFDWSNIPSDYGKIINTTTTYPFGGFLEEKLLPENHPVNKPLTSLIPEDLLLLNYNCVYLLFTETPEIKTHNITVTFHEGEKSISATEEITFE